MIRRFDQGDFREGMLLRIAESSWLSVVCELSLKK